MRRQAPSKPAKPEHAPVRLLTYNIHGCVGLDGREDAARVFSVIREVNADIIALQEVDNYHVADRTLIQSLRALPEYTLIYGPTLEKPHGRYGNALLSRFPVVSRQLIDLSVPYREPRGAVSAVVEHDGALVAAVTTHLGLGIAERRHQVESLLDHLKVQYRDLDLDLRLLMGDFNEWFFLGHPLRRLRRHFGGAHARRTFPSRFPLLALDRIWVKPGRRLEKLFVVTTPLARRASDHLPLVAQLRV